MGVPAPYPPVCCSQATQDREACVLCQAIHTAHFPDEPEMEGEGGGRGEGSGGQGGPGGAGVRVYLFRVYLFIF